MISFLKTLIATLVGLGLGLAMTFFAVERGMGFGAVQAGPWTGWPKTGTRDADPYARAVLARTGETPVGITEGLNFLARTDSGGALLDPRCTYTVGSSSPPARYWTLTALGPQGRSFDQARLREGFTSAEILRQSDGGFEITISATARPGNWLQIPADQPFLLMLRLYDTSLSASANSIDAQIMPKVTRGRCG